ncbi:MAG: NTP transferase domain-containing protein [Oscillospiraceae bacterium]|nr:NTP transferase domain-containing protein [Oscillospiraceae bacterium]
MKAVITAGGEGTRLWPVTALRPKPMVRLLGRPVLDYTLELLRKNGFDDICITLRCLPDQVIARYGDGTGAGVSLRTRVESEPLGTAGSVRDLSGFFAGEDALVISGDCVCDLDLAAAMAYHREKNADATIITVKSDDPTEYGAVVSSEDGRITAFSEKPAWENVVTADISTGIYVISPRCLDLIPENREYDFGHDLFPDMLKRDLKLFAFGAEGYWRDVGTPEAYLQCSKDALSGLIELPALSPRISGGVWSASPVPAGAVAAPPVYIGEDVLIEPGARLGPFAALGSGSRICRGAAVSGSILDGAVMKRGSAAEGAILCEGAVLGEGSALLPGSVLGDGAVVGKCSVVPESTRVPPAVAIPDNTRFRPGDNPWLRGFSPSLCLGGFIRGTGGGTIAPWAGYSVGAALSNLGTCVISHDGSPCAAAAALAVESGVLLSGGKAVCCDAKYDAAAAFASSLCSAAASVFIAAPDNEPYIRLFGREGLPLSRSMERRVEAALRGDRPNISCHTIKNRETLMGVDLALASAASKCCGIEGSVTVAVPGRSLAARTLKDALVSGGCRVVSHVRGAPEFIVSRDGFRLRVTTEEGRPLSWEQTLLLTALAAIKSGEDRIAAPPGAPSAIERLGVPVLRGGGEAEALLARQPFMRFGAFAAALICRALKTGETVTDLSSRLPEFYTASREVPVASSRAAVMDALRRLNVGFSAELSGGLTARAGMSGRLSVSSSRERNSLIIRAEDDSESAAESLADDCSRQIRNLDSKI